MHLTLSAEESRYTIVREDTLVEMGSNTDELERKSESAAFNKEDCVLCQNPNGLTTIINSALYKRYCSSLNYYYIRDIVKILKGVRGPIHIQFLECVAFDERKEHLKRIYQMKNFSIKFKQLWKFHQFTLN